MSTARVDGVDLYYELHGRDDAPALVFVNGIFQDTTAWAAFLPAFTERYRCLLYDCRGQGRSDKPDAPYATARHAEDLRALLDALGIERPRIVGLSNGGAAALLFAAAHPERVGALVVADTYAHVDAALRAKLRALLLALDAGGLGLRFDVLVPWNFSAGFLDAHGALLGALRARVLAGSASATANLIRGALENAERAALERIACPTLVLVGAEDLLTPPWYAREIAAGIAGARLVTIDGAGHAMPVERPDAFRDAVLPFLAETD